MSLLRDINDLADKARAELAHKQGLVRIVSRVNELLRDAAIDQHGGISDPEDRMVARMGDLIKLTGVDAVADEMRRLRTRANGLEQALRHVVDNDYAERLIRQYVTE